MTLCRKFSRKAFFIAATLLLNAAVISASEYIYNEAGEAAEVYDFSSGMVTATSEFIWKKLNAAGTVWDYLTTPETPGAGDNLYFTGENVANIKLDADVTVNDIIFSFEKTTAPVVTSGSEIITIDLNGYNLTCNDFMFNNATTCAANVKIVDTSASPGTLTINGTLDYSDNLSHTLTISNGVKIDASGATYSAGSGTGGLAISGTGSIELPVGTSDSNLSITGVSTNIITVACSLSNTTRSAFTSAKKSTITLSCTEASHLEVMLTYEITIDTPFGNPSFKIGSSNLSDGTNVGSLIFEEDTNPQTFDITYTGTFSASDSIYITIRNGTDEIAQASIVPDSPYWTGSVNTAWNNVANWVGITDITNLNTASEIYIPSAATRPPEVTGNLAAGSGTTTFYIGKDISSTGSMTFNGSIILDGNITLTSSGAMTFNGSIDSTPSAAASDLILDAGAQITVNNGPIGSTDPIGDLTVKYNYESTGASAITCSGALVFEKPCLFTSDMTAASFESQDECTLSSTGSLLKITTTSGNQSFANEVLLLSDVQLITPDNGSVAFTGNVESHVSHRSSLTVGNPLGTAKTNLSVTGSCGNTRPLNDLYVSGNFAAGNVKTNDFYVAGTITAGNVTADGDFTAKSTTSVSSISISGASTIEGNVTSTGDAAFTDDVSLKGTFTAADVTITGDTTLTGNTIFDATSVTFSGEVDSDGNNLTIGTNSNATTATFAGDVIRTSTLTLYGNTTLSGAVTINVNNWANPSSKTITPGTSTVTVKDSITGSNNFNNLTTTGTSLSFEAGKTQTIGGTFTAAGTALQSSTDGTQWNINVASANAVVSNVTVKDSNSVNLITPTGSNSNLGNNINWDIGSSYRWIGGTSAAWKTASNWQMKTTGTTWITATSYPGQFSSTDDALVGSANKTTNWPEFSGASDLSITKIQIGDSNTDTTSKLNFSASADLILSDATPVVNYGTITYTSTGRLKNNAATPSAVADNAHGTVYFDTGAVVIDNTNTGNDYYNLTVNGTGHTLDDAVNVAGKFVLNTSSSITGGTSLSVTGTSSIGGNITTTGAQSYTGIVTATADCAFTSSGGTLAFNSRIDATGFDITASATSTTLRGNVTAKTVDITGKITFGNALRTVSTTSTQTYHGAAEINSEDAANKLTLTAGNTVTFDSTVKNYNSSTTAALITGTSTNTVFKGNISGLAEISVTGNSTFQGTISTTGAISVGGNSIFQGNVSTTSTISVDGTTSFTSTVSSISSTGAQTYTGAVTYASDITFNAGSNSTTDITCSSSFTDSSATPHNVTIDKGHFKIGTASFIAGVVTVEPTGAFTQTGDNGTNTQSVKALINNGFMTWDSTGAGGTLSVTGTASDGGISSNSTDYTDHLIVFNKKNVDIQNNNSISGVFYNLTIPAGKTYTNGLELTVRNNFTATGTYINDGKSLRLGDTTVNGTTYANGDDGLITGTESGTPSTLSLGNIVIRQGNKTKIFKSNVTIARLTCGDNTTGGSIIFEKNLTVTGTPSLTTKGSYIFNSTANGTTVNFASDVAITDAAKVTIGKNFTSSGNISIDADTELSEDTVITASNKNITFGKTISKGASASSAQLTVTTGTGTSSVITFTNSVNADKVQITNYGTLVLNKSASIAAANGFTLSGNGNVTIGEAGDSTALSIATTSQPILFDGTGLITLNGTGVKTFTTGNSGSGNITINKAIVGTTTLTNPLTLNAGNTASAGNINLNNDIGTTTVLLGPLAVTGKNISLDAAKKISASSVSITNTGLLYLKSGSQITATNGFTKTGAGLTQLSSTIQTTNSNISFNTTTYIEGTSTLNAGTGTITVGTNTTDDLYVSAISGTTAQNVSFTANLLNVKGNFALFNGNVTLAANLTTGKDIVLLNGASSTMNDDTHDTNKSSGITGLFDYHNALRTTANKLCPPSLVLATTSKFPELMADGTTAIGHTTYRSTLTGFGSKTITAGQNFYDNGVNLSPTAAWTLKLKDNDSAVNAFAEAYNATISYCSVACITTNGYAWLSASENCTDGGSNSNDTSATLTYTPGVTTGTYTRTKTGVAFLHPVMLENNPSNSASEGRKTGPEIPNLSGTYSVRDNVIRIEFVRSDNHNKTALIENSNNEISRALAASGIIKVNNGSDTFTGSAYIDAECTETTDGRGDLAVIYIQASSITWNLSATGTNAGDATDKDSHGNHQTNLTDLTIERALSTLFYTLTDEHKNRISQYKNNPSSNPNANEGFRFTATATRCAVAEMHISFTVADFTSNKIYLYFDQPLSDNITWQTYHPATEDDKKTESSIKIITAPGSASFVANPVVSVSRDGISQNGIILTLQNNLSYSMLEYGIVIKYGGSFLFDNKIHSPDNHVVEDGESHCISDVITNCIDVQYAYDNRNDAYIDFTGGTAPADSIVMRDFTGEGKHNKVFAEKNITLVTKDVAPEDGTSVAANFKYKLIADINPTAHSDGDIFESISGHRTRFWFAEGTNAVTGFSQFLNTSSDKRNSSDNSDVITQTVDSTDTTIIKYLFKNFPEETPCLNWPKGSDVRFTFEVLKGSGTAYSINHKYDAAATQTTPLYAVRLKNPNDISTIDLWSFKMAEPQRQRGGVTVYSNVVNATNKEFCTIEVNMPSQGNLRVIVMTADGNIVKYLENGRKPEGLHYYYWDGTNKSGTAVARGIYFIRVVGPEMEETRKVMVVK
ncbi:FlgD immunoglobulin-like domain containing protein [Treponema sp.]|uniref:FlgD immunoglobulin-like domain containing protein n=1 Tax=Treponema sp. TaxID=166 RepID=UPI00388F251F